MDKAEISLFDESLDRAKTEDYVLNIGISNNELAYCVLDSKRNKFIGFESYRLERIYNQFQLGNKIEELMKELSWLTGSFKTVRIIYTNRKSTLIPVPLYEESEKDMYFNFNHNLEENEDLGCEKLVNLNAYNLYGVTSYVKNKLREIFKTFVFKHHLTTLIESLLLLNRNSTGRKVFININSALFDIIILNNNKLEYNNTFEGHTPEDFIYYVLFVLQQLNLNPENTEVVLMGEIEKKSAYYDILYKYVRNVSFIKRNEGFQYSYVFDNMSGWSHFNLLNAGLTD
jgi:hypothetical protein